MAAGVILDSIAMRKIYRVIEPGCHPAFLFAGLLPLGWFWLRSVGLPLHYPFDETDIIRFACLAIAIVVTAVVIVCYRAWMRMEMIETSPDGVSLHWGEECRWYVPWDSIAHVTRGKVADSGRYEDTSVMVIADIEGGKHEFPIWTICGSMPKLNELIEEFKDRGLDYRVKGVSHLESYLAD